ncbi:MAG: Hsp20/alpha crystallin family protein [Candidatus Methylomirabilia bacterium]
MFNRFFDREEEWIPTRMKWPLRDFQWDLDDLFGHLFGADWPAMGGRERAGYLWPPVETSAADADFIVRAELPRFTRENVEASMRGNTLAIQGARKTGREAQGEVSYRRFSSAIALPKEVDPRKVRATLANGILKVRMPASPKLVGKRIPVEVEASQAQRSARRVFLAWIRQFYSLVWAKVASVLERRRGS